MVFVCVCMYVCMYVCMCVCVCVCMCVCVSRDMKLVWLQSYNIVEIVCMSALQDDQYKGNLISVGSNSERFPREGVE